MDAVLIKRTLGVLLLLGVTSICVAKESSLIEQRVLKLVSERFVQAHNDLEKTIEACDDKRIVVPAHSFSSVSLTDRELKTALLVFHTKAEDACYEGSKAKFVMALGIYNTTVAHYGKTTEELGVSYSPGYSPENYSEELLFGHYWRQLEAEAKYLTISKDKRAILESIPALQQPFYLFKTLSELGVLDQETP